MNKRTFWEIKSNTDDSNDNKNTKLNSNDDNNQVGPFSSINTLNNNNNNNQVGPFSSINTLNNQVGPFSSMNTLNNNKNNNQVGPFSSINTLNNQVGPFSSMNTLNNNKNNNQVGPFSSINTLNNNKNNNQSSSALNTSDNNELKEDNKSNNSVFLISTHGGIVYKNDGDKHTIVTTVIPKNKMLIKVTMSAFGVSNYVWFTREIKSIDTMIKNNLSNLLNNDFDIVMDTVIQIQTFMKKIMNRTIQLHINDERNKKKNKKKTDFDWKYMTNEHNSVKINVSIEDDVIANKLFTVDDEEKNEPGPDYKIIEYNADKTTHNIPLKPKKSGEYIYLSELLSKSNKDIIIIFDFSCSSLCSNGLCKSSDKVKRKIIQKNKHMPYGGNKTNKRKNKTNKRKCKNKTNKRKRKNK
jgi:hypothetical protein